VPAFFSRKEGRGVGRGRRKNRLPPLSQSQGGPEAWGKREGVIGRYVKNPATSAGVRLCEPCGSRGLESEECALPNKTQGIGKKRGRKGRQLRTITSTATADWEKKKRLFPEIDCSGGKSDRGGKGKVGRWGKRGSGSGNPVCWRKFHDHREKKETRKTNRRRPRGYSLSCERKWGRK